MLHRPVREDLTDTFTFQQSPEVRERGNMLSGHEKTASAKALQGERVWRF